VAVIEVKGHKGLVPHYKKHQLHKYKDNFPNAKQFVVYSTNKDNFKENLKDFVFERCF